MTARLSTRAVVVRGAGVALEQIEVEHPHSGEVLVRIAATGVCGSDLHVLHGTSPVAVLPLVLGHEGAGVVEEVGEGVTDVTPGDHVVLALYGPCGRCRFCRSGRFPLCDGTTRVSAISGLMEDGSTRVRAPDGMPVRPFVGLGTMAGYAVVRESQVVKIDPAIPLDLICLAGCGVTTGLGAVFNIAHVSPGDSVAVVGCGGVGLNVIQGARIAGATTIVALDTNPRKLDLAARLGATHTADPTAAGIRLAVDAIVPGGVDVGFEVVGAPALVAETFTATRPGGTTVMVGSPPAGSTIPIDGRALFSERKLLGCTGGSNVPARDIPRIVALYEDGALDLEALVTRRRPLAEFAVAVADAERGEVARTVLLP
jgi:S-(hydroxymethyl)glutathione dehydrogenase / alcohol dehydrogenase